MKPAAEIRAAWLAQLHSTVPADRARAETGVRALYAAAGFAEPRYFLWFDSPCAASWAVAVLVPRGHVSASQLLSPKVLSRDDTERLERTRAVIMQQLGLSDWNEALARIGEPRIGSLQVGMNPLRLFASAFIEARYDIVDDVSALFTVHGDEDALARAESHFWGAHWGVLNSALHCPTTNWLIRQSFVDEQSFSRLADDEDCVGDRELPPVLRASAEIARSSGMWWPFESAAILCDRPSEIHVNERGVPHRVDGPAVMFRDGWEVYAWNGKAVPEHWIMQTETVPPREYQGFDPTFRKFAESKRKPAGKTKRAKPGSILEAALAPDPAARLEQLRTAGGGRLPLFDRYQAGEHREVWRELVSLGAGVREDPRAADALAVAYETMRRVESNVRTIVHRLEGLRYVFTPDGPAAPKTATAPRPHVPPSPNARRAVASFEKEFGTLPLSLRAFYEVVGEVNLIGTHPMIDPKDGAVATDPLVVYGLDEGIVEYDEEGDDEDGQRPTAVTIAPDDLHKANTSGGDAYEISIPDLRADGELLNERHRLMFVDYLRLCFEFGGFPGYEGRSRVPTELDLLRDGLLPF